MKINYTWLKQLLISILGTSIGIGLTFTVNRCVDSHKQQEAQRETAIMAVCDIAEIVQGLKEEIHLEDSLFNVAMYVSTHQELIDKMSIDTLNMAFEYLYDNPMVVKGWTANTKENAFNSGIDARMNLGNNKFYDNVQSCYYVRRSLIKVMGEAPMFRRPVRKEDYENFLQHLNPDEIDYNGIPSPESRRAVLKQIFTKGETTLYIKRYFSRRDAYLRATNELERLNRENKLLMDITDEDIEKYIKMNFDNISEEASADLLIGTWEIEFNNHTHTFVFHDDSIFEKTFPVDLNAQIKLTEEQKDVFILAPTTIHMKGRWNLEGDKLTLDYDCSTAEILSLDMDVSNFPQAALERLKDSMEIKKAKMRDFLLEDLRQQTLKDSCTISFDKSANTMVWTLETTSPTGNKQKTTLQAKRKQE